MGSVNAIAILATLLVLQPLTATSNLLSPMVAPIFDNVCEKVQCGKGKCKPALNTTFFFECECDPGWKQTSSGHDNHLKFLPCIVPNCTMNHGCEEAPSPAQQKPTKAPESSVFDPCHWTDCRGGTCNKTSTFKYTCECAEGYYNLLNVSYFACYKECSIGMDCANLGISMPNKSPVPESDGNAAPNLVGSYHWLIILLMFLPLVMV